VDFSARSLAGYESAWQKKLAGELGWGYMGRRFMEFLGDRALNSLFRWAARSGTLDTLAAADDLAFDWHARALGRLVRYRLTSPFRRSGRREN
jgi:flavin-dependent dehydrogenase